MLTSNRIYHPSVRNITVWRCHRAGCRSVKAIKTLDGFRLSASVADYAKAQRIADELERDALQLTKPKAA